MGVIYLPDPNAEFQKQMLQQSREHYERSRPGGTDDQDKMKALLGQQALSDAQYSAEQRRINDPIAAANTAAEQARAVSAEARAAAAEARLKEQALQATAANKQAFDKNAQDTNNSKAVKSVGANRFTGDSPQVPLLPEDAFLSQWVNPMVESANRFAAGTHATQNERSYADLGEVGQRHLRDQSAAQHPLAQLSELQLGNAWNNDLGIRSKGAGNQVQSVQTGKDGESTTVATPQDVIDIAKKAEDAKLLAASGKGQNDRAESLLKDFRGEKTVQNYYGAKAAIDTIRQSVASSAKNPTGANDITLLTSFMRSIDPGSTVREGEFKTAAESGGLPDQVMGYYYKLTGQGRLTQEQRQQILATSEQNFKSHEATMESIRQQYASHADKLDISPHYFARESGEAPAAAREGGSSTAAPAASGTPPTEFGSYKDFKAQSANLPPGTQVKFAAKGQKFIGTVEEALSLPESDFADPPPAAAVAPPSDTYDPTGKGLLPNLKKWWDTPPDSDGWLDRVPPTESSKQINAEMDAAQKGNGLTGVYLFDALRRAVTGGVAGPASVWGDVNGLTSTHTALPFDKDAHAASLPTRNPALAARKEEDQKQKDADQKLRQLQSLDLMPVDEGLTSGVTLVNEALTNLPPQQQSDLLSWFQLNPRASASAIRQKVTTLLK